MNGVPNGATLPNESDEDIDEDADEDTYEDIDKEEDYESERELPKLFNHCLNLFRILNERAVGDDGDKIYIGSISPLLIELGLASSYQSKLVARLKEMGSIAMLKRGSGAVSKSVWGLYKEPTIDDFYATDNTGDIKWRREKEKYDEHTQRIRDLQRRVTALEDFARKQGMVI